MSTQIAILMQNHKQLSKSIYVEAHLAAALRPWNGLALQTNFQFNNLQIKHNTDDSAKNETRFFCFTAPEEDNYLIDASITIKFMKEASGIGLPTFIYKIHIFKNNKWELAKTMQWQFNGVTQKPNRTSKELSSIGTLKSTDIIRLGKNEKTRFLLACKSLMVNSTEISISPPTSFIITSLR